MPNDTAIHHFIRSLQIKIFGEPVKYVSRS